MSAHNHLSNIASMNAATLFPPALTWVHHTGWSVYFAQSQNGIYRIKKAFKKGGYVLWLDHKALCEVPTVSGAAHYAEKHLAGEWVP